MTLHKKISFIEFKNIRMRKFIELNFESFLINFNDLSFDQDSGRTTASIQ